MRWTMRPTQGGGGHSEGLRAVAAQGEGAGGGTAAVQRAGSIGDAAPAHGDGNVEERR